MVAVETLAVVAVAADIVVVGSWENSAELPAASLQFGTFLVVPSCSADPFPVDSFLNELPLGTFEAAVVAVGSAVVVVAAAARETYPADFASVAVVVPALKRNETEKNIPKGQVRK